MTASTTTITPAAAKLTELDIYLITGHTPYGQRGHRIEQLFNNAATVEDLHRAINKPIPKGVKPDAVVDLSEFLPRLWTAKEIAAEHGIPIFDVELRIELANGGHSDGRNDEGELYYLEPDSLKKWVIDSEAVTVESLESTGINRRTIAAVIENDRFIFPLDRIEGGRTVQYVFLQDALDALKRAGHHPITPRTSR